MKQYDYLIVGSGLFGTTFAHQATKKGKRCLIIDKRSHLGGNIYCENIEGINVHRYGAHIFHTSNEKVWNFVNSIVPFNRFTNSPIANYKGKLYNLPFNMNTFYQMWGVSRPDQAKEIIESQKTEFMQTLKKEYDCSDIGIYQPQNLEEQAIMLIGRDIYETLIKGYTEKQWGRRCSDLPSFIIKRLPVRYTYDNNYFNDLYQGVPIGGYNRLINGLIKGIEARTDTDYFEDRHYWDNLSEKIVFTGRIDEYFDFCLGELDYRSVKFEHEIMNTPNFQGNAVVNYTDKDIPYTRIIEHKHFEYFDEAIYKNEKTVISREYSTEWKSGIEPYYPINDNKNNKLADEYRKLALNKKKVIFGGRLAEYKYYDMAPIIEKVLGITEF